MIGLLIVDDHPVVRSGIVGMLSSEEGLEVVGEAADGAEAVEVIERTRPDLALLDGAAPTPAHTPPTILLLVLLTSLPMGVHSFQCGCSISIHDTRVSRGTSAAHCGNRRCPGDSGRTVGQHENR